jgi:hypothetical protein
MRNGFSRPVAVIMAAASLSACSLLKKAPPAPAPQTSAQLGAIVDGVVHDYGVSPLLSGDAATAAQARASKVGLHCVYPSGQFQDYTGFADIRSSRPNIVTQAWNCAIVPPAPAS